MQGSRAIQPFTQPSLTQFKSQSFRSPGQVKPSPSEHTVTPNHIPDVPLEKNILKNRNSSFVIITHSPKQHLQTPNPDNPDMNKCRWNNSPILKKKKSGQLPSTASPKLQVHDSTFIAGNGAEKLDTGSLSIYQHDINETNSSEKQDKLYDSNPEAFALPSGADPETILRDYRKQLNQELEGITKTTREYYQEALEKLLTKHDINLDKLNEWKKSAEQLNLKPDPIIEAIRDPKRSDEVRAIEMRFFKEGAKNFKCEEFRICLENMMIYAKFLEKGYNDWADQLSTLMNEIDNELKKQKEIPYLRLLLLAFKLAELSTVVINFKNQSMSDRQKNAEVILSLKDISSESVRVDYHSTFEYMLKLVEGKCEIFVWPCFDALDLEFFVNKSLYEICPAGILPMPAAFHDHRVMDTSYFYFHDWFHAINIYKQRKTEWEDELIPRRQNGNDYSDRKIALEKVKSLIISEPELSQAINMLVFDFTHEQCTDIAMFNKKGFYMTMNSWVNKGSLKYSIIERFMKGHYEENVTKEDIINACVLLRKNFPLPQ